MQVLNCLIVEDEPLAADVIRDYIHQVPGLVLKAVCENAFVAMEKLREQNIDLIFLDINLPKLNGIDFIKTIKNSHQVILTTAYNQYALEGYELNITDYLLKPVEFNRFLQAVNKAFEKQGIAMASPAKERKPLFFNVDKKYIKIFAEDILYIEGLKDYVRIHTHEKKIVTKYQVGDIELLLKESDFLRIHKSFIINPAKINSYTASEIDINGIKLRIGRTYRKTADAFFKKPGSSQG